MKKILKWSAVVMVSLMVVGAIVGKSPQDAKAPEILASSKPEPSGYTLQPKETKILVALMHDNSQSLSRGDFSFDRSLTYVSAKEVAQSYEENQVAADKKYYGKKLMIQGQISSINSGIGNEPYIVLRGSNNFILPQIHFSNADIDKISETKKGQTAAFVCTGGGAIIGSPMFKNCDFADNYAKENSNILSADIKTFLQGKTVKNKDAQIVVISAIAMARSLPDSSPCFVADDKCANELQKLAKKASWPNEVPKVVAELSARGLKVDM